MVSHLKKAQKNDNFTYVTGACDVCQTETNLMKVGDKWVCTRHRRVEEWKPIAKAKIDLEKRYTTYFDRIKMGST